MSKNFYLYKNIIGVDASVSGWHCQEDGTDFIAHKLVSYHK